MDFNLKQWRNQHDDESDQQHPQPSAAKMPKLFPDHHHQQQQHTTDSYTALPLFAPEPNSTACHKISNLSAFPDHSISSVTNSPRFPRMESCFSLAQIQELELQAMIYRYMREGATVPPELLQPIKKSLLYSTPYFLHPSLSHYSYCQQTWYWGRGAMDPEPGRCRRTDGKKWRCSRDVVAGQKYCERHVHRGRNRSRKPVEIPTPSSKTTATGISNGRGAAAGSVFSSSTTGSAQAAMFNGANVSLSRQSHDSIDLLHLNNSTSGSKTESKALLGPPTQNDHVGVKPDGHVLRHFFDDWPRSLQEPDSNARNIPSPLSSATCLSISMPGNSSSDVSLKLSTGNGEDDEPAGGPEGNEREQPTLNWGGSGWGTNQVSSMGGPLAEALRSSVSNSSPTSVLHQLHRGSASEAGYVST